MPDGPWSAGSDTCAAVQPPPRFSLWSRRSSTGTSRLSWRCSATSTPTSGRSGNSYRTTMAKKKIPKLTPEDHARHERIMEMVQERIAYHEAKAREQDEARGREQK